MITDFIIDNFEILVKLAVGTFCAFLIAVGFVMFIGICYVIYDEWKRRKKNEKNTDSSSLS